MSHRKKSWFFSFFVCIDVKNEKNVIFWRVPAQFWWKTIEKSWFLNFCGYEKCKNRNFRLVFMQNLIFGILWHFIFVEKPMKKWRFCNSEILKIAKSLFFQWFFAKNEKFYKFTSRWWEKKISMVVQMVQKMSLRPFFRMPR